MKIPFHTLARHCLRPTSHVALSASSATPRGNRVVSRGEAEIAEMKKRLVCNAFSWPGTLCTLLLSLASFSIGAQEVVRTSVVLGVGEEAIYTTADSIATVSSPPGTNQPPKEIVRIAPQQYGNTIRIRGVRKGEVKLLVEST